MARRYSFEDLVSVIKERLSLINFEHDFQIKFDTLGKQYIILGNIDKILGLVEEEYDNSNLILYKYMSLDTYFSSIRIHHCQNGDEENLLWTKYGSLINPYHDLFFLHFIA